MRNTQEMARYAIYIAIITMFAQIPQLGFISFGVVAVTTLPIVIAPMLMLENNWRSTFFISIVWGLNSWLAAILRAADPVSLWFRNPLIGFLPRVLAGILAYTIMRQIISLAKKIEIKNVNAWTTVVTILTVSVFIVIGTMIPSGTNDSWKTIFMVLGGIFGYVFANILHQRIQEDHTAAPLVFIGLIGGAAIAVANTVLVLLSWKLFITDESELVNTVVDYVIGTSGVIELTITAFITMSVFPSLAIIRKANGTKLRR